MCDCLFLYSTKMGKILASLLLLQKLSYLDIEGREILFSVSLGVTQYRMFVTRVLCAAVKRTTGLVGVPVIPNARAVLVELYDKTLENVKVRRYLFVSYEIEDSCRCRVSEECRSIYQLPKARCSGK